MVNIPKTGQREKDNAEKMKNRVKRRRDPAITYEMAHAGIAELDLWGLDHHVSLEAIASAYIAMWRLRRHRVADDSHVMVASPYDAVASEE